MAGVRRCWAEQMDIDNQGDGLERVGLVLRPGGGGLGGSAGIQGGGDPMVVKAQQWSIWERMQRERGRRRAECRFRQNEQEHEELRDGVEKQAQEGDLTEGSSRSGSEKREVP